MLLRAFVVGLAARTGQLRRFCRRCAPRYKPSSSSAATDSATTSNQPNLPSTLSTAFTMAKGDVVQQDKSFMGMPVSRSFRFQQAVQFQRPRPAIGDRPSQCHQRCLSNGLTMLRDGSAVAGQVLEILRLSWSDLLHIRILY